MIESTSSCTKASGWKANVFDCPRHDVAQERGLRACPRGASSQLWSRSAIPGAFAIPPIPAADFIVALALGDGELAKEENAERGSVAIQFGFPRPAFR